MRVLQLLKPVSKVLIVWIQTNLMLTAQVCRTSPNSFYFRGSGGFSSGFPGLLTQAINKFRLFFILGSRTGPELVPLDSGRNSMQNRGSFASGAPSATQFVTKMIFWTTLEKNEKSPHKQYREKEGRVFPQKGIYGKEGRGFPWKKMSEIYGNMKSGW